MQTHLEIFEQIVDTRIDIERVEPKGEDTSFSFSFRIKVFDDWSFVLFERFETGVGVEQIGDESEVEFCVSSDEGSRSEVFAASDGVSVLEDLQNRPIIQQEDGMKTSRNETYLFGSSVKISFL